MLVGLSVVNSVSYDYHSWVPRILRAFQYTRSCYTLWLVDFDSFCQQWSVFDHREKCDMAVMTDSTSCHAEFELATNTALSDFPNMEPKREEKRNCLKHLVGRIGVFAILPTGFGKSLFQPFPQIKRALEWRQDRMSFTIVVVTPLIAIMRDQAEHLNKIGVAVATMGDVDEAVKSGSCEIVYRGPKSWLCKEWTKGLREGKLGKQVAAIAIDEVHSSPNGKFFLKLLCTLIAWVNDLYWNGCLSKWVIFVCHLLHNFFTHWNHVLKP